MTYIIAIPSYNRATALKTHTLKILEKNLIPHEIIHIFVANDEEYLLYKKVLGDEYKIIVGVEGLRDQRNFITDYFPIHTKIISIDDDIQDFYMKSNDNKLNSIQDNLHDVFMLGFKSCMMYKANLFGFYPCLNKMFMNEKTTTDLRFIIGSCFGYINTGVHITVKQKQDYELSLLHYLRDNTVIRFNYISMKTKYYKMKGGLQSFHNRYEEQQIAVEYLLTSYPEYFKRKKSFKTTGFPEIRLVTK